MRLLAEVRFLDRRVFPDLFRRARRYDLAVDSNHLSPLAGRELALGLDPRVGKSSGRAFGAARVEKADARSCGNQRSKNAIEDDSLVIKPDAHTADSAAAQQSRDQSNAWKC
jgi:hypothetical protein